MREEVRAKIVEVLKSEGARIHLVGVGGTGMSALARLLIGAGYRVSGSDLHASVPVEKLVGRGLSFIRSTSGLSCWRAIWSSIPRRSGRGIPSG